MLNGANPACIQAQLTFNVLSDYVQRQHVAHTDQLQGFISYRTLQLNETSLRMRQAETFGSHQVHDLLWQELIHCATHTTPVDENRPS
jgi:hypothetical protein